MLERQTISLDTNPEVAEAQISFVSTVRSYLATLREDTRRQKREELGAFYLSIRSNKELSPSQKAQEFNRVAQELVEENFPEEVNLKPKKTKARRSLVKPPSNLGKFQFVPLITEALRFNERLMSENYQRTRAERELFTKNFFGDSYKTTRPFSPSIAAICLRWAGYESTKTPQDKSIKPTKALIASMIGTAAHYEMGRTIGKVIDRRIMQIETGMYSDEPQMSGRMDYVFENINAGGRKQLIDLKFVSSFVFKNVKRERVPEYLKNEPFYPINDIVNRRQALLYLWNADKNGDPFFSVTIVYINKDSGEMKEAFMLWDEDAKYEAQQYVDLMIKAQKDLDTKGELPLPTISQENKGFYCGQVCPHRIKCEYASEFVAKAIKRRDIPLQIRRLAKKNNEERIGKALENGAFQTKINFER